MDKRGARLGQLILCPWNNVIHHITARPYWPFRSISRVKYHQLTWYNSLWLWRCLLHTCRLSNRLSLSTTVLWWQDQILTILVVFFYSSSSIHALQHHNWHSENPIQLIRQPRSRFTCAWSDGCSCHWLWCQQSPHLLDWQCSKRNKTLFSKW